MTKVFFVLLAILGGMMTGVQAPVNGELGKRIGGFEGAFISFFVGTLFLTIIMLFFGRGQIINVFSVPRWQLIGGVLGAFFVTVVILAVQNVGVALTIFAAIFGQMLIGLVIDHFGFFGVQRIEINLSRLMGLLFMIFGLFFLYRGSLTP